MKVEIEKKALENMEDFNTVAVFSILDPLNYGYLDFENIKNFYMKYKKEDVLKEDINAILRRMNDDSDARINFREFSLAITPEMAGLTPEAAELEFNPEQKRQLEEEKKYLDTEKVGKKLKSAEKVKQLRNFR